MISELKKKEIDSVNEIIAAMESEKKDILGQIKRIEDKYRSMIEKETKLLSNDIEAIDNRLQLWKSMLPDPYAEPEKKPEEEPEITDTLFPENNEAENGGDVETKSDEDVPSAAEGEEKAEPGADSNSGEPESKIADAESSDDLDWPEPEADKAPEDATPEDDFPKDDGDDEWPDFPQEWK